MLRNQKQLVNKLIHLSTRDYPSGYEDAKKSMLTAILPNQVTQVQTIKLINFTLPYTYYNIDSTNNILNFSVGVTNYSVTVDTGNYDVYKLLESLRSKMSTIASNGWALAFDLTTNRVTITGTSAFSILSTSSISSVLGITQSYSDVLSCKFEQGVNLLKATQILLHCSAVSSMSSTSSSDTILASINIPSSSYQFGDVINNNGNLYNHYPVKFPNLSQLDFWFTNEKNQGLFLNNYDFTVDIEVVYFE